jgi:hypothetical protein
MFMKRFTDSLFGRILISVLLGLGLATLFRKVCKDRKCMVFRAPDISNIKDKIFKYNDKCYQYTEKSESCKTTNKKIVDFA